MTSSGKIGDGKGRQVLDTASRPTGDGSGPSTEQRTGAGVDKPEAGQAGGDNFARAASEPRLESSRLQPETPTHTTLQRSFALLGAHRRGLDPLARDYRHGEIPRASFGSPKQLRRGYFDVVFSAAERQQIEAYYALPLAERLARSDEIIALCDTPDKVAALLGQQFTWVDEHQGSETWSVTEMIATGRGVCRDQHHAARAILEHHGYDASEVAYADGDAHHAVCVFKDKDGKWYLLDYDGLIHPEGAESRRQLLAGIDAGNFSWVVFEKTDARPSAYGERIWTEAGLSTLGFLHGTPAGDLALSPGRFNTTATKVFTSRHGFRAGAEVTEKHATLSGGFGDFDFDLRTYLPGSDSTMQGAFGAAVRYRPQVSGVLTDASLNLSGIHLPERGSRSIGGAGLAGTQPLSLLGIAGNLTLQPYNWELWQDHLFLVGDLDLRGAYALGYNHGTAKLDIASHQYLSHLNTTWRNQLRLQWTDPLQRWGVRAWGGPTFNIDLAQASLHFVTGGRGVPPFNFTLDAGIEGAYKNLALGGRVYVPLETTSNLYREDPAFDLYGGYHYNDFRFLTQMSGSLDEPGIETIQGGIGWRWLKAEVGHDFSTGATTATAGATFRF